MLYDLIIHKVHIFFRLVFSCKTEFSVDNNAEIGMPIQLVDMYNWYAYTIRRHVQLVGL